MTPRRRQFGLSLIELMVSVTLGLLILSGVLVVFVNTSAARNEVERTSRQIENGRYASELLTEDLRLAGFYGELNVASPRAGCVAGRSVLAHAGRLACMDTDSSSGVRRRWLRLAQLHAAESPGQYRRSRNTPCARMCRRRAGLRRGGEAASRTCRCRFAPPR